MDDPTIGNRTSQWFWQMVTNLGLGSMSDRLFNEEYVKETINKFMNREFEPDGKGSLFRIRNCQQDLREVEIWMAMLWYLDSLV